MLEPELQAARKEIVSDGYDMSFGESSIYTGTKNFKLTLLSKGSFDGIYLEKPASLSHYC